MPEYDLDRCPMELDEAGDYYTKHVMAMTSESLHSKMHIAQELGHRDMVIDKLEAMLRKKLDLIKSGIAHNYSGYPYENELYTEVVSLLDNTLEAV